MTFSLFDAIILALLEMIANDYKTMSAESSSSRYASVSSEENYFFADNKITNFEPYNKRHGGPFDRGTCDSWYSRGCDPHFYIGDSYSSTRIEEKDMRPDELRAYNAGYAENEADRSMRKDYN